MWTGLTNGTRSRSGGLAGASPPCCGRQWADNTVSSRPVREIAIVGLGTMGCGIAETGLLHGFVVSVVDSADAETAEGVERIRERVARQVRADLIPADL